jgi:hypothetical protein
VSLGRRELSARLDALAGEHEGAAFVAAVKQLAAGLEDEDRAVLGQLLVARADERGGLDYGLIRRIDEPRWKLFGRRPTEPGRD